MGAETLIGDYLIDHFPLGQIKKIMYFPDDIYYKIPVLVFRFDKLLCKKIYTELKVCIEEYSGILAWTMFESFYGKKIRNYIICPEEIYQMQKVCFDNKNIISPQDFFSKEKYKYLCEKAIEDIPFLYAHLRENFKPDLKKYFLIDSTISE